MLEAPADALSVLRPRTLASVVYRQALPQKAQPVRSTPLRYACLNCSGPVVRVRRRLVDRLLSALIQLSLRRYACIHCGWQGNLKRLPVAGKQAHGTDFRYRGHSRI